MCQYFPAIQPRVGVSNSKLVSLLLSYFVAQYVPTIVVQFFLWKYISVFEKWLFSFDRKNMQVFTVNITWVVWPRVMNILDFRYFCQHNPLFYHLNLIPCHCWSWQRNIYFLVNTFVWHTFPMSKSSITESSELLAFKRQKDGYKVTVNVYLCICVVPSWDELKVRQNLLASDYEIYMVCLLVATVHCHKLLQ